MTTQHAMSSSSEAKVEVRTAIPPARLRHLRNVTPFAHLQCQKMGQLRRHHDIVVVKGTFDLKPGPLRLSDHQEPIFLADKLHGTARPQHASLLRAGDLHLAKPGADVYVTGTARAPGGRPVRSWEASVLVRGERTSATYVLRACGPRAWAHRLLSGWRLSAPGPTAEIPIRYELAYGGAYPKSNNKRGIDWCAHGPNPSGRGVTDTSALDPDQRYAAPRWEQPSDRVTRMNAHVAVAGFGPVARWWTSRAQYAGTCDDAWRAEAKRARARGMSTDYPHDFDPRFFHCAPPELRLPNALRGDEHIALGGLVSEEPKLAFQLPDLGMQAALFTSRARSGDEALRLDTVHIDLDASTVSLLWRLSLGHDREVKTAVLYWKDLRS